MHLLVQAAPQNPRKVNTKRKPKTVMTIRMSEKWSAVELSAFSSGTISNERISSDWSRRYTDPPTTASEAICERRGELANFFEVCYKATVTAVISYSDSGDRFWAKTLHRVLSGHS